MNYISDYTRALRGNRLILPRFIAQLIEQRNQGSDNLTAFECIDIDYSWISLYDKSTEARSVPGEAQKSIDDLAIEENKLKLTGMIKKFLGIEGEITIMGNYDHLELWHPDEFQRSRESIPYNQLLKLAHS